MDEKTLKEELARVKARESLNRKNAEARILSLEAEIGKLRSGLQNANNKLREAKKANREMKLSRAALEAEMAKWKERAREMEEQAREGLPGMESLQAAADFLENQRPAMRKLLRRESFDPDNLAAFICRCGNREAIISLWLAARQMAFDEGGRGGWSGFLAGMLVFHQMGGSSGLSCLNPQAAQFEESGAHGWWVIPYREKWWEHPEKVEGVIMPGLRDAGGQTLVEPMLALSPN